MKKRKKENRKVGKVRRKSEKRKRKKSEKNERKSNKRVFLLACWIFCMIRRISVAVVRRQFFEWRIEIFS